MLQRVWRIEPMNLGDGDVPSIRLFGCHIYYRIAVNR